MTGRYLLSLCVFVTCWALLMACSKDTPVLDPGETPTAVVEAIAPTTVTPNPPPRSPSPTPAPAKEPKPPANARPFTDIERRTLEPTLKKVEELRGSPARSDVAMNLVGRRAAIESYREGYDDEDVRLLTLEQDVYRLLGMIPQKSSLVDLFLGALGAGILGFYDPQLKSFYLLDDLGGVDASTGRITIVHEYAHALQDQYYDLNALDRARRGDFDASLALAYLLEGDAVATEGAYTGSTPRRAACFEIPPVTSSATIPFVIQRLLRSWYEDGYCFVKAIAPDEPARAAPLLFANPPATSEQVLHPDKYRAGETAMSVSLPAVESVLGEGWQEQGRSDFGEFVLQNLLVLGLRSDRPRAQDAAAGWGGDAWVLYTNADARLLEGVIAWDTPDDARVFFDTLHASLASRVERQRLPPIGPASFNLQLDTATWRVALSNDRVTLLVSTDAPALERVATRLGLP